MDLAWFDASASRSLFWGVGTAAAAIVVLHFFRPSLVRRVISMGCCSSTEEKKKQPDAAADRSEPLLPSDKEAAATPPVPLAEPEPRIEDRLETVRDPRTGALVPPATQLTARLLTQLEASVIPPHFSGRKWQLLHSTATHGYNAGTLRRRCEEAVAAARVKSRDTAALLLVWAGGEVFGAYLSCLPEWNTKGSRTFLGTTATTVFAVVDDELRTYRGLSRDDEDGNERFLRADDIAISVGGGGGGAAIRVTENLARVKTCGPSATFAGLDAPLLQRALDAASPTAEKDVDGIAAPVKNLELLVTTESVA